MKRMIVGTVLGRCVMAVRNEVDIIRAVYFQRERLGTLVNDQYATLLVTRLGQPKKAFIDVGAHIGSIIAAVARHNSSMRMIAIEAVPEKVANLRRRFPFVEVHECAVGDSEGEVSFFVNTRDSGYSSLARPTGDRSSSCVEITTPKRKLDNLVSHDGIDIVKIDVEGAELGVLYGAEEIVSKSRPVVMFESAPDEHNGLGYTKEAMWQWFVEREYEMLVPNRVAHNGPGLSQEGFVESHFYPRRTTNYFAIPIERRVEIRDRARNVLNISIA